MSVRDISKRQEVMESRAEKSQGLKKPGLSAAQDNSEIPDCHLILTIMASHVMSVRVSIITQSTKLDSYINTI
jgi:hypothetical protein